MRSSSVAFIVAGTLALSGFAAHEAFAEPPTTMPATTMPARDDAAAIGRANRAIASGLEFLRSQQNADGSWGAKTEPPAITALPLRAFAREGRQNEAFVLRGFERLLSFQAADGGIYRDLLANYNTSIALSALAAADEPNYQPAINRAIAYLKGLQWTPDTRPDYPGAPGEKVAEANQGKQVVADEQDTFFGGWGYGGRSRGAGRPDLSNAQMALEALHAAGVPSDDPAMQRAVDFLTRCQNASTNDQAWAGTDGGFVYGPADDRDGESMAGEYVDANGKRMLRSYGSMTYAGLKSMLYAGLTKEDPRVIAATDWIRANWTLDENPGMKLNNPENAKAGLFYYYHTLARALAANKEPTLTLPDGRVVDWRIELIDKLTSSQGADGSWIGERRWMESNPVLATSYLVAALQDARDDLNKTSR